MSSFRSLERSDPRFTPDGLHFITVKSKHLGGRGDLVAYVPENAKDQELPMVLLLHGVYGSAWAWAFKGGAHRTAGRLIQENKIPPLVLIMPSDGLFGDGSGYSEMVHGNYEKWILEDVPASIKEAFSELIFDNHLFICGLSMGGYGALRIGAKYPNHFSGISGHSSVTGKEEWAEFIEESLDALLPKSKEEYDPMHWIQKNKASLPPLRFDCGFSDPLLESNRMLHANLSALDIPHIYQEFPGGHEWSYWEEHLTDSLLFFGRQLIRH
ncbi:MAG: esterase family protein [Saprospiraceae bacterium]|nr:esterase family protein [Saprospiraceae bacterium]